MKEHPIWSGFFVLEGIDGSGTTTQLKSITARAVRENIPLIGTNEPTDGPVGRLIRSVLRSEQTLNRGTLARLFGADRYEHLYGAGGIRAFLDQGTQVISDRYVFSSLAYQSQELPWEMVWDINKDFPLPERLFFLDLDPQVALDRVYRRGGKLEIFENLPFQTKVREKYHEIIEIYQRLGCSVLVIDATKSPQEIEEIIWSALGQSR